MGQNKEDAGDLVGLQIINQTTTKPISRCNLLFPSTTGICLFKINNGNTKTMHGIFLKLAITTPERRRSSAFISIFEQIPHIAQVLPLLFLNK